MPGKKTGWIASRSPHRPNPIGLSLVKIESVNPQDNSLAVSGIDLVNGTPVLDLKPYHPADKPLDDQQVRFPPWLDSLQPLGVSWSQTALTQLTAATERGFKFYSDFAQAKQAAEECIKADPRPSDVRTKQEKQGKLGIFAVSLDRIDVAFKFTDKLLVKIINVHYWNDNEIRLPVRTKEWYNQMSLLQNVE